MIRNRVRRGVAVAAASLLGAVPMLAQQPSVAKSTLHDYRVVTVATGFVNPWSIAFLPTGEMLVTERAGRLRVVRGGQLLPTPVAGVG